jgi:hypothetical protein
LQDKLFYCVIEDLIDSGVVDEFRRQNPGCLRKDVVECAGAFHVDILRDYKGKLVRFVDQNALLSDVSDLVDLLKALRCLLRLPVDGTPAGGLA